MLSFCLSLIYIWKLCKQWNMQLLGPALICPTVCRGHLGWVEWRKYKAEKVRPSQRSPQTIFVSKVVSLLYELYKPFSFLQYMQPLILLSNQFWWLETKGTAGTSPLVAFILNWGVKPCNIIPHLHLWMKHQPIVLSSCWNRNWDDFPWKTLQRLARL